MLDSALLERVTRTLALMLRHQPELFDLELDSHGYGDAEEVVRALEERLGVHLTVDELGEALRSTDRVRYELVDGRIRALYGHSIPIEAGPASKPPERLFVGLCAADAERALRQGLRGGRRRFLHLSSTPEEAAEAARRAGRDWAVLAVHALEGWEEGVNFYDRQSLWLTEHIPGALLEAHTHGDDGTDPRPDERRREPRDRQDRRERQDRHDRHGRGHRHEGGAREYGGHAHERGGPGGEHAGHIHASEPVHAGAPSEFAGEPVEAPQGNGEGRAPGEGHGHAHGGHGDERERGRGRRGGRGRGRGHDEGGSHGGGRHHEGGHHGGAHHGGGAHGGGAHGGGAHGGGAHGGGARERHGERHMDRAPEPQHERRSAPPAAQPAPAPARRDAPAMSSTDFGLGIFDGGSDGASKARAAAPVEAPRREPPPPPRAAPPPADDGGGFGAGL